MKLDGFNKVVFNDFSQYVEGKSCNGGCYGFWVTYHRTGDVFTAVHGTTAEFDYCPVCGSFSSHYEGDDSCFESEYSCGEYETVSEEQLLELIRDFKEDDECYIEYK